MNHAIPQGSILKTPSKHELVKAGEMDSSDDFDLYPSPALPMMVARRLVDELFTTIGGHKTLSYWKGCWWKWEGPHWRRVEDEIALKAPIWARLEEVSYLDKSDEKAWAPSSAKVKALMEPLRILTRIDLDVAPAWLDDRPSPRADRVVSMANGLLDLGTLTLSDHTPALFNTGSFEFPYIPEAKCPEWKAFLGDIFEHDPKAELLLQEYTGYLLSGRLEMQKALLIVGPPRAGKGVISRTLQRLVGEGNSISPSLSSLSSEFGLAELVGKGLAVIEDARGSTNRQAGGSVERLLNIIGEDAVSANRKNEGYWNGTLPTRFILMANEVPQFIDSSGAIKSRFMAIKLRKSYVDNPDTTLGERISAEAPGIFNWALAGLDRLDAQGAFTKPETMDGLIGLMGELGAPVQTFLNEVCSVTGQEEDRIRVSDFHRAFNAWQRLRSPSSKEISQADLRRELESATPLVIYRQTVAPGETKRDRWFLGIRMMS